MHEPNALPLSYGLLPKGLLIMETGTAHLITPPEDNVSLLQPIFTVCLEDIEPPAHH